MTDTTRQEIISAIEGLADVSGTSIGDGTKLTGPDAVIDSLAIVELLMALEDMATARGLIFAWDDEPELFAEGAAFHTVGSLVAYFKDQIGDDDGPAS